MRLMRAQKQIETEPFRAGPDATKAAIEQLGYVQIDTINVIERCHRHILYTAFQFTAGVAFVIHKLTRNRSSNIGLMHFDMYRQKICSFFLAT